VNGSVRCPRGGRKTKASAIRILQTELGRHGLFGGRVDGRRDGAFDQAAQVLVLQRRSEVHSDPTDWSARRTVIAALQLVLRDLGQEPGPVDGLWGPLTEFAHDNLLHLRAFGAPIQFRDTEPSTANPNGWPRDNTPSQSALTGFFGSPGVKDGRSPPMTLVDCPWTLKMAWDLTSRSNRIGCHTKVAPSLARVLKRVHDHYGAERITELRLDIYGGCYNPRKKRGGSTWSTHAWAIALDFDPDNNKLEWGRDRATFARPAYDPWWAAWEAEGWVSLGRQRNFDWMHVQAAWL